MNSFIKIFKLLNKMEQEKIIDKWAIGGSIGIMFYTESFLTKDIDIFIYISLQKGDIVNFGEIYSWLIKRGHAFKGQHIIIDNIAVDFIPTTSGLIEEAVLHAIKIKVTNFTVKVISPEYLIAVALQVGRHQDYAKIDKLVEQYKLNIKKLNKILSAFSLNNKWNKYAK